MQLQGLHHVTMITGDAQRNVEFYAGVLGLRLVKKTVNFDQPETYHLYFGDERGSPGSILTWFEFAGAAPGRAGAGTIHTIALTVASEQALGFWEQRLREHGYPSSRGERTLRFEDYDGLAFELVVPGDSNPPLRAEHPEVPAEHAILGIEGARAYADHDAAATLLTDTLGFSHLGDGEYRLDGPERHFHWAYDPPPPERARLGAGSVHHIAWASRDEDHLGWQQRVRDGGSQVTDVRDRDYFQSIYFREPRGILFEIATLSPGFAADEDPEHLGEELRVPAMHAHLREQLERTLTRCSIPAARERAGLPRAPRHRRPRAARAAPRSRRRRARPARPRRRARSSAAPAHGDPARAADPPRLAGAPLVRRPARRLPGPRQLPRASARAARRWRPRSAAGSRRCARRCAPSARATWTAS